MFLKIAMVIFWVLFVSQFFFPFAGHYILIIGYLLLAIHLLEYALVGRQLARLGQPLFTSIVNTLLFGILYWRPLLKKR